MGVAVGSGGHTRGVGVSVGVHVAVGTAVGVGLGITSGGHPGGLGGLILRPVCGLQV